MRNKGIGGHQLPNYISSIIFKIEKSPSSTTLCKLLKNRCGTLETVEI